MNEVFANILARLVRDVLRNEVTPETVALANIIDCEADFVLVIAGANLDNLAAATALALEEIGRL